MSSQVKPSQQTMAKMGMLGLNAGSSMLWLGSIMLGLNLISLLQGGQSLPDTVSIYLIAWPIHGKASMLKERWDHAGAQLQVRRVGRPMGPSLNRKTLRFVWGSEHHSDSHSFVISQAHGLKTS